MSSSEGVFELRIEFSEANNVELGIGNWVLKRQIKKASTMEETQEEEYSFINQLTLYQWIQNERKNHGLIHFYLLIVSTSIERPTNL